MGIAVEITDGLRTCFDHHTILIYFAIKIVYKMNSKNIVPLSNDYFNAPAIKADGTITNKIHSSIPRS